LLNILLELSPLEVFVKCYKLRATKYTFVEQSSGIPEECSTKDIFCNPQFVTLYKELQGR
jgi:hypothetical protein